MKKVVYATVRFNLFMQAKLKRPKRSFQHTKRQIEKEREDEEEEKGETEETEKARPERPSK